MTRDGSASSVTPVAADNAPAIGPVPRNILALSPKYFGLACGIEPARFFGIGSVEGVAGRTPVAAPVFGAVAGSCGTLLWGPAGEFTAFGLISVAPAVGLDLSYTITCPVFCPKSPGTAIT